MINKFQTNRDRKQQQGINRALKAWYESHPVQQQTLEVRRRPISRPEPKPKFVPSTMCELGFVMEIKK